MTIERNVIIGNAKGIALGNPGAPNSQIFTYPYHAKDVVIRNNFILRGDYWTGNNIGLELCNTNGVEVYNNTFYGDDPGYFRMISPYDENGGAALTNLTITNNIIRGHSWDHATGDWSNADLIAMGNIVDPTGAVITPEWFVDPLAGDLHLTAAATAAIGTATPLAMVTEDIDTGFRHATSPDMGADEFQIPWPGDANQDGVVGLSDLVALADNYGRGNMATWAQGDFTRDGWVGLADLSLLADHYGDAPGLDGVTPEPATIALLALGAAALIRRRRRV